MESASKGKEGKGNRRVMRSCKHRWDLGPLHKIWYLVFD
jgi:hypothetical protein